MAVQFSSGRNSFRKFGASRRPVRWQSRQKVSATSFASSVCSLREKFKQQFHQPRQRDAVGAVDFGEQPVAEAEKIVNGDAPLLPDQRRGGDEVAAVADQVPVAREAAQPLHRGKINQLVLQNLIRRMGVVNHLPFGVMPDDGRAAQPFQNADLDFLRAERDEFVKAGGKTFQRFARQADNQIGVDVDAVSFRRKLKLSAIRS